MTDVRWYLDIDGVVSAMFPPATADTYVCRQIPGDTQHWFQPKVIEFINSVAASGVEVVWLTNWERDDAIECFAPTVGLADFRHIPCLSQFGTEDFWWKRDAILVDLETNPAGSVVWTDDDVTPDDVAAVEQVVSRSLLLAPNPNPGLTTVHTNQIAGFLRA